MGQRGHGEPAVTITPMDTIGAGDWFMSALLFGLAASGFSGENAHNRVAEIPLPVLRQIVQQASKAAAITCTRPGANPRTLAELVEYRC